MPPRGRKRRRSCVLQHPQDSSESDDNQVPNPNSESDGGSGGAPARAQNVLDGGKFHPNCDYIKRLEEWVQYAEHVSFDYRVDFFTYIYKGHAILAAHQQTFYKCPSRYLWFLMNLPASDDAPDAAHQALVRSASVRLHEMLEAHVLLEQLVVSNHGSDQGQCEAKLGALGWSPATQLWHVLCILRFHIAMVQQLLYVYENDVRAVARLKHVRMVPRTLCIAELCGMSYDTLDGANVGAPTTTAVVTTVLPRLMCPPELLHSACTLAPVLLGMGCVLYPHLPIGLYSQFQVYEQLSFLAQRLCDVDIGQPTLTLFVRALHLRVCELLHHTYVVPTAWEQALLPCDVGPSRPLDMVPAERYRLAHRFGGVGPAERPTTLDLSTVGDGNKKKKGDTPYQYKPDKASDTESVSPSRAFVDEVLGLIAPIHRQLVLVRNITRPPTCILDESDIVIGVGGENLEARRNRLLDQWSAQCAAQMTNRKRSRINYAMLMRVFDATLDLQRSRIIDLSYRDDLCVHMRRMCLTSNLPERYAHVPANIFARTYNSELLENAFLPRLVFQARNEQWRQLELHELEQAPYIPIAARTYAQMCTMRTLGYVHGEDDSWLARYTLFHYQLEQLSDRIHLDDSPFVLVLGARCYVRRGERFFACNSAREAMLVWLMFVMIDHPREHRRDFVKCVSTDKWVTLGKELVSNAFKSSSSAEQSVLVHHAARLERVPRHALDIDLRTGETSDEEDELSGSDSSGASDSAESDQEENLVERYMQCDDLL